MTRSDVFVDAHLPAIDTADEARCQCRRRLRSVIAVHVAAVAFCAMMSLADRGLFISHAVSHVIESSPVFSLLQIPAVLALFVCPLLIIVLATVCRRECNAAFAILAELALIFGHLQALLPAVM